MIPQSYHHTILGAKRCFAEECDKEEFISTELSTDRRFLKKQHQYDPAINLSHNFYEVDYLPENDRIRYTISPEARKEVLKRLLLLNHKIYIEEVVQGLHYKKKSAKSTKKKTKKNQPQTTTKDHSIFK